MVITLFIFVLRTQQISCDILNFVCRGEKLAAFSFPASSEVNCCFLLNVLNNKTIIQLNLAEYHVIFANLASVLVG